MRDILIDIENEKIIQRFQNTRNCREKLSCTPFGHIYKEQLFIFIE